MDLTLSFLLQTRSVAENKLIKSMVSKHISYCYLLIEGRKSSKKYMLILRKKSMESKSAETMGEHYLSKDDFFSPA